jgi:5-formyltetrahydrofolate cyclo-ligase
MLPVSSYVLEEKRALRREMKDRRERLSSDERRARSVAATARLLALPELANVEGRVVAGYAAFRGELDPAGALADVAARGGAVVLPRVSEATPRLRFRRVEPGTSLEPGRWGILEPGNISAEVGLCDVDLVIVPGLAWDATGNRVGYGGGYYDEALGAARASGRAVAIGFCYDFQVVDKCPAGEGDVPVDLVVTDARVLRP